MRKYIVITILSFFAFLPLCKADDLIEVKLSKCVDGDTAWFIYEGKEAKFRFLALDTPESTNQIEEYGKEASKYTCTQLKNATKIEIEFDNNSEKQDKYDRYLAWIFVNGELLQGKIISEGLGEVKYLYGDYKYTSSLKKVQIEAQNNKKGIWSNTDNNDTEINYYYIGISLIIIIIFYIFSKKYRNKINRKIKNNVKKKIRELY